MDQKIRRVHPPAFKAKVAVEALREQKTIAELSSMYAVHTTQITKWKRQALDILTQGFSAGWKQREKDDTKLIQELYRQIGRLKVEVDFLKKRWAFLASRNHFTPRDIAWHINKTVSMLPKGAQADLLGISRSSLYYEPRPIPLETLSVMNGIDEVYTAHPFYGSLRIARELGVNRKQIQRLMRKMGIEAIYPKPNLSKNNFPHPVYPFLLKGVRAAYPNHIWGTDITYIRMAHGYLYLVAFLDWFSRFVLSWKLSTTLEAEFVIKAANNALQKYGAPEIENSDQGIQYTNEKYINIWKPYDVKISMDSRGRAMDNIFTERLWGSLKYEEVYLKDYETVKEAKGNIGSYIQFYNYERKHQSLNYKTPSEIYFKNLKKGDVVI